MLNTKEDNEMLRLSLKKSESHKNEFANRLDFLTNGCKGLQETVKKTQKQIETCKFVN